MTVIPQLGYRGARMIIHVGLRTISLYIFLFIKRSTSIFINNIRLLTYTYYTTSKGHGRSLIHASMLEG